MLNEYPSLLEVIMRIKAAVTHSTGASFVIEEIELDEPEMG